MSDSKVEQVAHKLGIPWPSAEEGQLRQAATAFDAAAKAVDAQRQVCTAKVRSVTASNTGGGLEQFASFWGRYDGSGAGGGAMPATATALRDTASALRQFADEVQKTKDSIRHKVEIAGAALVVGAIAAVFTLGASAAVATAAAEALAAFAVAAGVALSETVAAIIAGALVGAAFGAVESMAIDTLVVQPMSIALGEQDSFDLGQVGSYGLTGAAGGFLGGGAGGALSRLPALAESTAVNLPRLSGTLDGLTSFTGSTGGRLATNGLLGAGTAEALSGGKANGFDVLAGTLGGLAAPGAVRRRSPVVEPEAGPSRIVRDDNDFGALNNFKGVPKAHIEPDGTLVAANPQGKTTLVQHVIGNNNTPQIKGNSPYISFKPPDNTGKSFGANRVEVDLVRLRSDVAAGKVPGVEVLPPKAIEAEIQTSLDSTLGRHLEVPRAASPAELKAFMRDNGLNTPANKDARDMVMAMANTRRDSEWLVRGHVPADYLVGPYANSKP